MSNFSSSAFAESGLLEQFCSALKQLKGEPVIVKTKDDLASAIIGILKSNQVLEVVIAGVPTELASYIEAYLEKSEGNIGATIIDPFLQINSVGKTALERCKDAGAGITWAEYAIAANGALVEIVNDDIIKLASSLPIVHIALLPASRIIPNVDSALENVRGIMLEKVNVRSPLPIVSFISGPSKTSDIELRLLYGVHGPLTLSVVILGWM